MTSFKKPLPLTTEQNAFGEVDALHSEVSLINAYFLYVLFLSN